jgi:hypothetical protein
MGTICVRGAHKAGITCGDDPCTRFVLSFNLFLRRLSRLLRFSSTSCSYAFFFFSINRVFLLFFFFWLPAFLRITFYFPPFFFYLPLVSLSVWVLCVVPLTLRYFLVISQGHQKELNFEFHCLPMPNAGLIGLISAYQSDLPFVIGHGKR